MIRLDNIPQLLNKNEHYCLPGLNEIKCITSDQTLSLALGSCISTVFIGKNDTYYLAANHIVIAKPHRESIVAKRSAEEQICEIDSLFRDDLKIDKNNILCLYLIGAGTRKAGRDFTVPIDNIIESMKILGKLDYPLLFHDTGSYFFATFSLQNDKLSVFIENKFKNAHLSFIIDLKMLFSAIGRELPVQSISALAPHSEGFEKLVDANIITFITGDKSRKYG